MSTCTGSQLQQLRRIGVPVFVKPKPFLMHHKFAVVDDEVLVCGSFNWTRQAALGNNEDVIITNNPQLVRPFVGEFHKLWAMKEK
ncbi:mitochondrial cardiolipin hydrolase-like [Pollicipes pollicipes]|nr:mitochondrial cardiolipin hydrolase-like [Pollicipes pollicipes]